MAIDKDEIESEIEDTPPIPDLTEDFSDESRDSSDSSDDSSDDIQDDIKLREYRKDVLNRLSAIEKYNKEISEKLGKSEPKSKPSGPSKPSKTKLITDGISNVGSKIKEYKRSFLQALVLGLIIKIKDIIEWWNSPGGPGTIGILGWLGLQIAEWFKTSKDVILKFFSETIPEWFTMLTKYWQENDIIDIIGGKFKETWNSLSSFVVDSGAWLHDYFTKKYGKKGIWGWYEDVGYWTLSQLGDMMDVLGEFLLGDTWRKDGRKGVQMALDWAVNAYNNYGPKIDKFFNDYDNYNASVALYNLLGGTKGSWADKLLMNPEEFRIKKLEEQNDETEDKEKFSDSQKEILGQYRDKEIKKLQAMKAQGIKVDETKYWSQVNKNIYKKIGNTSTSSLTKTSKTNNENAFYKVSLNTRISSLTAGTVTKVENMGDEGYTIQVRNNDNSIVSYHHLRKSFVRVNNSVLAGEPIGLSGSLSKKSIKKEDELLKITLKDANGKTVNPNTYVKNINRNKTINTNKSENNIKASTINNNTSSTSSSGMTQEDKDSQDDKILSAADALSKITNIKPNSTLGNTIDRTVMD